MQLEEGTDKYCSPCKSPVSANSKHCVRCNRCTQNFDHHCKWVNNCVSSLNYRLFIVLIVACFVLEVLIFVVCGLVWIFAYFFKAEINQNISNFYSADGAFNALIAFQAILCFEGLIFSVLLGYLIALHIYLNKKGWTTYEYILQKQVGHRVAPRRNRSDTSLMHNNSIHEENSRLQPEVHESGKEKRV
jgi:hypothetical protein